MSTALARRSARLAVVLAALAALSLAACRPNHPTPVQSGDPITTTTTEPTEAETEDTTVDVTEPEGETDSGGSGPTTTGTDQTDANQTGDAANDGATEG